MTGNQGINLYEARKHRTFQIVSVPPVGLLENLGVYAGTRVAIQARYAFGGPVLLRVAGAYLVAVGKDIAKQIVVMDDAAI